MFLKFLEIKLDISVDALESQRETFECSTGAASTQKLVQSGAIYCLIVFIAY